ncbi:MAG: TnpV protein [Oscillospiraceae bacterium]|nr:TnpV protein [Oscillospiraceae bacterium]
MTETLTYTMQGDYLLPDVTLPPLTPEDMQPLGRYGKMRKAFLKDHRTINYNRLLLTGKLFPHLREIDQAANSRLEQVMSELVKRTQLPDKATNQMGWTAAMNSLKAQAEEMVTNELIYA